MDTSAPSAVDPHWNVPSVNGENALIQTAPGMTPEKITNAQDANQRMGEIQPSVTRPDTARHPQLTRNVAGHPRQQATTCPYRLNSESCK